MHIYLKIKIKSLAAEASMIRSEEKKISTTYCQRKRMARDLHFGNTRGRDGARSGNLSEAQLARIKKKLNRAQAQLLNNNANKAFIGLRDHRRNEVRSHARSSYLAYGFLRGVDYNRIETNARFAPDWPEVKRLIEKFSEEGSQAWEQRFKDFKEAFENRFAK